MGDPEIIVAEFRYVSDGDGDEPPMNLPCCFVFRVRDGEIVGSRDYVLESSQGTSGAASVATS